MIETGHGDLLASEADALVNAVNTEGVMGKGLAAQFRAAWPSMFSAYRTACRHGDLRIGQLHVWPTGGFDPRYIVNLPTKAHFRDPSTLSYVDEGLAALARTAPELGLTSIAVPALGCGNGGLGWAEVRPLIDHHLATLDLRVLVFPPR